MKKKQKKIVLTTKIYDVILNKLLVWEFPEWPEDLVGCANLLHKENLRLFPYILPIRKVTGTFYHEISVIQLNEKMVGLGLPKALIVKYETWLDKCPFIGQDSSDFYFFVGNQLICPSKTYLRGQYGMFKQKGDFPPSRRKRGGSGGGEWVGLYCAVDLFGQPTTEFIEETHKNDKNTILFYIGDLEMVKKYRKDLEQMLKPSSGGSGGSALKYNKIYYEFK